MYWDPMTMDEFAMCQQAEGLKLVHLDGVWWVEIRPFFFRPLFPFAEIDPNSKRYPLKALVGGLLHVVPDGVAANSTMNFFVYDDLKNYSLETLSRKRRKVVMKGLENFTAKPLTDPDEFVATAYDVYMSFQKRTNYSYKDERVNREVFSEWARNLFRNPKIRKLGAYHKDKLCAVETSYRIEDVIIGDTLFANDLSLSLKVTDFLYHTLREAAVHTDARYFFVGLPTGVKSLDQSKLIRGCKLLNKPACYKINPLTLSVVKVFMKSSYHKLLEIIAPPPQQEDVDTLNLPRNSQEDESNQDCLQGPR
ncbi:MAG: hypothetical protein A2075_14235 [Geobacteraceae bacterium GWC2_58_44]|nr:MAG: hypothetical protein A2075_14235 [Geobacteraceae bacterium GWC2_58_44]HBG04524.1 hypothetical protein [Geobacter sp.]